MDICSIIGDPNLLEVAGSWPAEVQCEVRAAVQRDMQVLPDFISEHEEASLLAELEPVLKKMRYEFDHWDNVSSNTNLKLQFYSHTYVLIIHMQYLLKSYSIFKR